MMNLIRHIKPENFFLFGMLLFVDTFTKAIAVKDDWTFHASLGFPWLGIIGIFVFLFPLAYFHQTTGALVLAGAIGNIGWTALYGGAPNPILGQDENILIAYNIADICVYLAILPICFFISRDLWRLWRLRRRSLEV